MRNVAFTRISDDEERLNLWLSYYSRYFEDLFVFGHEARKEFFDGLMKKYKFDYAIDGNHIHSMESLNVIKKKQRKLLKDHKWVLYTDSDEFVIADPNRYKDLKDFMRKSKEKQTFCEGYNIYRQDDENPIVYTEPILKQRKLWWRDTSGSYNKPCLSRIPTDWTHGFHYLQDETEFEKVKKIANTGLFLIHIKNIEDINTQVRGTNIPEEIRRIF